MQMDEAAQLIRMEQHLAQVGVALDAALSRTRDEQSDSELDIWSDRTIIFSDQHRGARNGADDFQRCERVYNAALAYYYQMGYTLVLLGDAEELWEERPGPVLAAYEYTLGLEAQFHRQGRYLRCWGNHDDEWQFEGSVRRRLAPIYGGAPLKVREGLIIRVTDGPHRLGALFLVHGHQGSLVSDKFACVSRLLVRYVWRPFQRATKLSLNLPSNDWRLRERHNISMYSWAAKQRGLVLIAGHTHRPIFASQSHSALIKRLLDEKLESLRADPSNQELRKEVSLLAAELEWIRAQDGQRPGDEGTTPMRRPCYFNTGCCCYRDGDITGIEIAAGEIRLVRWPDAERRPRPGVLVRAPLREVFAALLD